MIPVISAFLIRLSRAPPFVLVNIPIVAYIIVQHLLSSNRAIKLSSFWHLSFVLWDLEFGIWDFPMVFTLWLHAVCAVVLCFLNEVYEYG